MRKSTFTPEQILQALRQAEGGTAVIDNLPEDGRHRDDVLPLAEAVHRLGRQ
jgi:hypothetical protein